MRLWTKSSQRALSSLAGCGIVFLCSPLYNRYIGIVHCIVFVMADIVLICKEVLVELIPILQLHFQNWLWANSRQSRLWTNIINDITYLLVFIIITKGGKCVWCETWAGLSAAAIGRVDQPTNLPMMLKMMMILIIFWWWFW